jgi:hypothetical protein
MQGDEEQAVIPGDDELLAMPGRDRAARDLRALAMKHGIRCHAHADMRTRPSMIRDHGLVFCLEGDDGVKRPLHQRDHRCELLATSQPEHLSLLYVCTYA